jgi:hypothetical protein
VNLVGHVIVPPPPVPSPLRGVYHEARTQEEHNAYIVNPKAGLCSRGEGLDED